MADLDATNLSSMQILWNAALTAGGLLMVHFFRKRDAEIDAHGTALDTQKGSLSALEIASRSALATLELKVAENYSSKATVLALFESATKTHDQAIARVEKRIDETNTTIGKTSDKIDKVSESITSFQTAVMHELAKKT